MTNIMLFIGLFRRRGFGVGATAARRKSVSADASVAWCVVIVAAPGVGLSEAGEEAWGKAGPMGGSDGSTASGTSSRD